MFPTTKMKLFEHVYLFISLFLSLNLPHFEIFVLNLTFIWLAYFPSSFFRKNIWLFTFCAIVRLKKNLLLLSCIVIPWLRIGILTCVPLFQMSMCVVSLYIESRNADQNLNLAWLSSCLGTTSLPENLLRFPLYATGVEISLGCDQVCSFFPDSFPTLWAFSIWKLVVQELF